MMPVIRARAGLTPTATAIPMHNGSATRNTTMDARKSWLRLSRQFVFSRSGAGSVVASLGHLISSWRGKSWVLR